MQTLIICAAGVGGATVLGAILGYLFRSGARRHSEAICSFAAGVMLAAAVSSLIAPAFDDADGFSCFLGIVGMFSGAAFLYLTERLLPTDNGGKGLRSAILFAIAMAIHNLPEGIAAGIGFGTGDTHGGLLVAIGIAIHNVPEGMITVFPMVSSGVKPAKAIILTLAGGVAEVLGTFVGYAAGGVAAPLLPFVLAFAGGTMLYVISSEMIPECSLAGPRRSAFLLIFGYCAMMVAAFMTS
ncbi:MAG: ZIP family metal transporter [Clostridia bacterium]|nr:ZIP family metal transporter [Clostridia bacterium]